MKRIYETGRSMVEMLGVLAVTGVLSIGGIMGYSYGMDKYRANETLNELQIRIIDLSQQMQNGAFDLSLGEMGNTTRMGYPISARVSPQFADYFEVFVDNVPSGVCHRLLESKWTVPYSIFVGIDEYEADESICDKAEKVRLAYEFKDDLTDGETIAEEERHETWRCNNDGDCKCATCENGLCVTLCPEGSSCAKSYDNPNSWMCCLNEKALNGLCCSSIGENGECCTSTDNCCPADKPLRSKDGLCYSCDDETIVNVEGMTQNCAVCSNRLLTGSKKYCALKCGLKGTTNENKPLMDKDGGCHACDEAKGVNVNGVEINCNVCAKEGRYISKQDANYCILCGVKGTSVEDKPLIWLHSGDCYSCDTTTDVRVNGAKACIEPCPNRVDKGNGWCKLNPCTDSTAPLFSGSDGKCHSCDYDLAIPLSELPYRQCKELCPNRKVEGDKCVLAGCPADKPLMDKDGGCHACDEAKGVNVNGVESNCDVCAKEGRYISKQDANYCILCGVKGTSVENKPLIWLHSGDCYSCNEKTDVRVKNEAACTDVCPNRVGDGWCKFNVCTDDVPLMDSEKNCHPCNEPTSIYVGTDEDKCNVCVNRRYEDGYCLLN